MNRVVCRCLLGLTLGFVGWTPCHSANTEEVMAVLSSESPPYQEALAGFQEAFGHGVPVVTLSREPLHLSKSIKVIVTFGGKAASYPYPQETTLIYALAPALFIGPAEHSGPRVRIYVAPKPDVLFSRLKELQPGLKRLAILDVLASPPKLEYVKTLRKSAAANDIQLRMEYLDDAGELPDRLRALVGKVDALWMAPNPLMITPTAFAVAKEFARSNNTPLYAPMDNLVDKGAAASVSSSFRESGRTAGRMALKAVAGTSNLEEIVYPEKYEMVINLTAAAQSGLQIPPEIIKKADRVVP